MKRYFLVFVLFFLFFLSPLSLEANYEGKFIATGTCSLRSGSTGNCFYKDTTFKKLVDNVYWVDTGDPVTVITTTEPVPAPTKGNGSECKTTFSYVNVKTRNTNYKGWLCTDNIHIAEVSEELQKEFTEAGFPESYWESLAILKEAHPSWQFVAIDTGLDFNTAVDNEDSGKKSLIQSTSSSTQGYLSTKSENYDWEKDKFTVYDGSNWYAANQETIAYYMDPRNFLIDMYIFQFEALSYNKELQTLEGVQTLLGNAYIAKFSDLFIKAAEKTGVNPIYLAALSRQEVGAGTTASAAVSGKKFTYDGKTYEGVYNFYNIGATSGVGGSTARGLVYAAEGLPNKTASFGRPWTSEEKAIIGGAEFIADTYITTGQDTSYFKKWNTVQKYAESKGIENVHKNYTHQYMQNIQAPSSEATTTYHSYVASGLIESAFTFHIPVYKNMPEKTSLPSKGNPNNLLKEIAIDGTKVEGFSSSNTSYKVYVDYGVEKVKVTAKTINSAATVTGTGETSLEVGDNTISLKVKAQNGDTKTYEVIIVRNEKLFEDDVTYPTVEEILAAAKITTRNDYIVDLTFGEKASDITTQILSVSATAKVTIINNKKEKTTESLVTGDQVTIQSGEDKKTLTVVLYGDVSGDGKISILDLLQLQKHILGSSKLTGASMEAADPSKDGKITILDLLKVQKHILGSSNISQK